MTCIISNELAEFFNNGSKTTMSRVEVTRRIDKYIEEHGLRYYTFIIPDEKLKNLLKCGDNEVTFSNLQSYIAPHIVLAPPPSAPPLSPESPPESVYAVLPEDEFPEPPPKPLFPSVAASAEDKKSAPSVCVYAVFSEDELPEDTLHHKPAFFNPALLHAVGVYRQAASWTWDTSRYYSDAHRYLPSPRLPDRLQKLHREYHLHRGINNCFS
jgi:hypothetical protein